MYQNGSYSARLIEVFIFYLGRPDELQIIRFIAYISWIVWVYVIP